jgi:hypothetical protein
VRRLFFILWPWRAFFVRDPDALVAIGMRWLSGRRAVLLVSSKAIRRVA